MSDSLLEIISEYKQNYPEFFCENCKRKTLWIDNHCRNGIEHLVRDEKSKPVPIIKKKRWKPRKIKGCFFCRGEMDASSRTCYNCNKSTKKLFLYFRAVFYLTNWKYHTCSYCGNFKHKTYKNCESCEINFSWKRK